MRSRLGYGWVTTLAVVWMVACQESPSAPVWMTNGLAEGGRTFQKLEPDTVHVVPLHCSGPSFLSATLEQVGSDLVLVLRGPEGTELAREDGPAGPKGVEFLAVRTSSGGAHRLEVRSPTGEGGAYVLELSQLRRLREGDEVRVEGWKELQSGHHAYLLGSTEKAWMDFETALEHFQRQPDAIGEAYTLHHLGWMAELREGPQAAIEHYDEALTRLAETTAPGVRAGLLADRASALLDLHQLQQARDHFRQALFLWSQAGDERNRTETLNSLGSVLKKLGEVDEAQRILSEVLALRRAQGDLEGEARTWGVLGEMYRSQGDLSRALEAHQRALDAARQIDNPDLEFGALINLGAVFRDLAEPQAALQRFDQALALEPKIRNPSAKRRLMSHLGLARGEIGDPAAAIPFFQRALELTLAPGERARTLLLWGWAEDDLGRREAALELYEKALELEPSGVSPEIRVLLHVGRARAFRRLGRLAEAQAAIEEADSEASRSTAGARVSRWLERGEIARLQGRQDEARDDLERALKSTREWGLAAQEAVALVRLGQLARDEGRLVEGLEFLEEALDLRESLRAQVTSSSLRTFYFSQRMYGFEAYLDLLVELDRRKPDEGWKEKAFAASERMRARTLNETLSRSLEESDRELPPDLIRRKRVAVENLQRVQRFLQVEGGEDRRAELDRWQQELERIQWQVDDTSAQVSTETSAPMTLDRARAVLPRDTVLLEYASGIERSFLFVVTRDDLFLQILPSPADIERRVRDLTEALSSQNRRLHLRWQQLSQTLYDTLIGSVEALLEDADQLLVVPTDELHYLPFEALWDGREHLIRRWAVSYTPSVSVLERLAEMKSVKNSSHMFVAFADPEPLAGWSVDAMRRTSEAEPTRSGVLAAIRAGELRRLPGARDEVRAIAEILAAEDVRLYMGLEATEARLKEDPDVRQARWLHLASHGILEDRAGFSSLYLAHEPASAEDGLLQVHEIGDLDLSAELVVLSACETGLGSMVRGEGLVGLSRAFLSAGARNLVVSLWKVEDRSTADLMVAFYRRLHQGEPPVRALRGAKLQLLSEGSRWTEPYYWAPFVLVGGS